MTKKKQHRHFSRLVFSKKETKATEASQFKNQAREFLIVASVKHLKYANLNLLSPKRQDER